MGEEGIADVVESSGRQGVRRQQADQLSLHDQWATQARVDVSSEVGSAYDQAVVRIGERALVGEASRLLGAADDVESRVVGSGEAAPEDVARETPTGDGDELVALAPQERDRIAGKCAMHGLDESARPVFGREGRGDVPRDGEELFELCWCHLDSDGIRFISVIGYQKYNNLPQAPLPAAL